MRAYERFLKYVAYDTTSSDASPTCPSTPGQLVLAKVLVDEMTEMGIENAHVDKDGYVYGWIPANIEGQPTIGLIAHMDTVDDAPALPMTAHIAYNYQGGDLVMDEAGRNILRESDYPHLHQCIGEDLILTDGNTLLGADNKAGIAEILAFAEHILTHPELKHGRIAIGFTPDEEIGRGADRFDVAGFGADFAYTLDGGLPPELEYENFNAASARIEINGLSIHPGGAKGKMKNASLIAMELNSLLPPAERPEHTEGYEGFYHLTDMSGTVEKAELRYIIRDHDKQLFAARKANMERIARYLNDKYGEGTIVLTLRDSYYNMKEVVEPHIHVVHRAEDALRKAGYTPVITPIRGGTDGATLSFRGLPCPNLPTGAMNSHGRFECITVQTMDKMVEMMEYLVCVQE